MRWSLGAHPPPRAPCRYGLDLFLLSIDEGISGYRDDSLETVGCWGTEWLWMGGHANAGPLCVRCRTGDTFPRPAVCTACVA